MPAQRSVKGFTLIELMVAISIVAILSTIGLVLFSSAQKGARDAKRKGDLEDIKKALYQVRASSGTFCFKGAGTCTTPIDVDGDDSAAGFNGNCSGTAAPYCLKTFLTGFLKVAPNDAIYTGNNDYNVYINGDDTFTLSAKLEATTATLAPDGCTVHQTGATPGTRNYCIRE